MDIIVNGERHDIPRGAIDYQTIANLVGKPNDEYLTITYHWSGPGDIERSGTIYKGKSIEGDDGMIFNAIRTGSA